MVSKRPKRDMEEVIAIEKLKAESKANLLLSMAKMFAPQQPAVPASQLPAVPASQPPAVPASWIAESKKDDRVQPPYMIRAPLGGICDCTERWFSDRGAPTADDPCPYCDGDSR